MDMTLFVPIIFIVIFVVACLSLFLVYKYGIKEKSYEEALAEQRQNTQILLNNKLKSKDKKVKKAAKKIKDKDKVEEPFSHLESKDDNISKPQTVHKLHVEFKQTPEELPLKDSPQNKKKLKKEKVKPILINKEEVENIVDSVVDDIVPANHFEEIHPKDEFELLRSNSKENVLSKSVKEKSRSKQSTDVESKDKKDGSPKELKKEEPSKQSKRKEESLKKDHKKKEDGSPKQEHIKKEDVQKQDCKPKEEVKKKEECDKQDIKKKDELAKKETELEKDQSKKKKIVDQYPSAKTTEEKLKEVEDNPPNPLLNNVTSGVPNTGKEKKKKKTDFNNLQQLVAEKDGPPLPVLLNLVRQAELSRSEVQILIDLLLNKQHEAPAAIGEWSEGKADPVQKLKKQLAEKEKALVEEQEALAGAQAKLREVRSEQLSERSQNQQKIRGLEEVLQARQLDIQNANKRLHAQTQQYQQLQAQLNEERNAMQLQIQQYEIRLAQMQEAEGINMQLRTDIQNLSDQNQQLHLELQRLTDEKNHQQNIIMQLNTCQEELKQKLDSIRHLESNLEVLRRKEGEYGVELSRLESLLQQQLDQIQTLESAKNNALEEVHLLKNHKEESDRLINQLRADLQKSIEQQAQLKEKQANGTLEESKSYEVEILNLHNALSSIKNDLQQKEIKYKSEVETYNNTIKNLEGELIEQKAKNNELRTRNWKVMEALNDAENKLRKLDKTDINFNKLSSEIHQKETEAQIEFIKRLFPNLDGIKSLSPSDKDWQLNCSNHIQSFISNLKKESPPSSPADNVEINKLKAENQHYKDIIDETEKRLNLIHSSVEQEEIRWRRRLQIKENELEIKEQISSKLKEKTDELELELEKERTEVRNLAEQCHQLKLKLETESSLAVVERLTQEVAHLTEQLQLEKEKNNDVNNSSKARNCNSANGPSLIEPNVN